MSFCQRTSLIHPPLFIMDATIYASCSALWLCYLKYSITNLHCQNNEKFSHIISIYFFDVSSSNSIIMIPRLPINLSEKAINCFLLCKIREIISLQSKGICLKLTEPKTALFNRSEEHTSELQSP